MKCENKAKNGYFSTIVIAICSFVGVGFITGAEIWFYFSRFGLGSVIGLAVFGFLIYFVLSLSICKSRVKNSKIEKLKTKILLFGELAVASAMVSGLFETTRLIFDRWWIFFYILAILVMSLLFIFEKKSYIIYNYILLIFIIFVIILLFIFNNNNSLINCSKSTLNFTAKNAILACVFSCVYVFSNVAEIRPVLECNTENFNIKQKKILCLILSLSLIFLAFMFGLQFFLNEELSKFSMPFLNLFKGKGGVVLWVYLIGLTMTMVSTADACLIGIKNKLNFSKNNEKFVKFIVIILSLILGQIPFKFFIKIIYPIVAIFNFLIFVLEILEFKFIKKF